MSERSPIAVPVRVPGPLLRLTGGKAQIGAQGSTVDEVIDDLERQFPGFREQLCDAKGTLRPWIHIFVNGQDIRFLGGLETQLAGTVRVAIVPAIAGGAGHLELKRNFPRLVPARYAGWRPRRHQRQPSSPTSS